MANSVRSIYTIVLLSISLLIVGYVVDVMALPSGGYPPTFKYRNGLWYDDWNITRNAWYGEDGYLPQMANESLGTNKELAYGLGQDFRSTYPEKVERAEEILKFVQKWMKYGHDEDYVTMGGEPQREWAWNADEMAHKIKEAQNSYSIARGDCEDFSFLCGIIYLGAGFEVALVSPEGHVALLIWLPEYPDANVYWDIGDGKGYGWIWVEATGDKNRLGWTPPEFGDGRFDVYLIMDPPSLEIVRVLFEPKNPTSKNNVTVTVQVRKLESEISQVSLLYYIKGETPTYDVPMDLTEESTFRGIIPSQKEGATVTFYVRVSDTTGSEVTSYEFTYSVERKIFGIKLEILALGIIIIGILVLLLVIK